MAQLNSYPALYASEDFPPHSPFHDWRCLPILDYALPLPSKRSPLAIAFFTAGFVLFFLISTLCLYLAVAFTCPDCLPFLLVTMAVTVVTYLDAHLSLRAFCLGIFTAILTLFIPMAALYLAWLAWPLL